MSSPLAQREIARARHSGLLNPTVFRLESLVSELMPNNDLSFATEDLSILPEELLEELLVAALSASREELRNREKAIAESKETYAALQQRNEALRETLIKMQGAATFFQEKHDAIQDEHRRDQEKDKLKFGELTSKRLQQERAMQKVEAEIRAQKMEAGRLARLL